MSLVRCFWKVFRNDFVRKSNLGHFGNTIARRSSFWEPDYLILAQTKTPEYDLINVQLKGYDFAILENYQKVIIRIAKFMNININNVWPAPQQDLLVHHYKQNSSVVLYKYDLKLCERNIQVVDVKSHIMPLFIEAVITCCPPGVKLSVHQHEDHMEEIRYVPNKYISELQEELENIGVDKKKKKK